MPKGPSFDALASLAAQQAGLLSASQLRQHVSRATIDRWVAQGRLERVRPGVVAVAGSARTPDRTIRAACLGAGAFAVAGHRSAGVLHRLDGVRAVGPELVGHAGRRVQGMGALVHRSTDLRDGDVTSVRGIPCTTVVRTLIDLGAVVPSPIVEQALDDALRRRLCDLGQIEQRFNEVARRGRDGVGVIRPLLEERLGKELAPSTGFEQRMIRLIRRAGLPDPVRQHRVALPRGGYVFLDLAWPDIGLAVECDDLASHFAARALRWDDQRQNDLQLLGWFVLRFTFHDVRDLPHRTAQVLLEAYHQRRAA